MKKKMNARRPPLSLWDWRSPLVVMGVSAAVLRALCVIALSLPGCSEPTEPCPPGERWAKVARVLDGDTALLETGDRVRYIGIDSPEEGECFADEATRFHAKLVNGKEIRLEFDVRMVDPYGRLLAYVHLDTMFVNAALLREGCCHAAAYPPNTKYRGLFEILEAEAKRHGRGLWGKCRRR